MNDYKHLNHRELLELYSTTKAIPARLREDFLCTYITDSRIAIDDDFMSSIGSFVTPKVFSSYPYLSEELKRKYSALYDENIWLDAKKKESSDEIKPKILLPEDLIVEANVERTEEKVQKHIDFSPSYYELEDEDAVW